MTPAKVASVLGLTLALAMNGATAEDGEHHALGPHVHGLASLDIAWDDQVVQIGLESPAANLVGFEHRPETDADRAALDAVAATLKDGERLFRFSPEAKCRLTEAEVARGLLGTFEPQGQNEGPEHAAGGGREEAHADLGAEYRFACAEPAKLRQVEVGLFRAFPATKSLRVQYVGPGGQAAGELTAASPVFNLQ